ncbi:hypothetical protein NWF32_10750 [Pseudomonas qingdaonensis]|nr:hypothetical protein [Pseudomonas qingdaonensis]
MEFRHLGNGLYFPPIAPNGRVYAVPLGQETQVEIFCLTPVGIMGAGIKSRWSEIVGFYYDDESWRSSRAITRDEECASAEAYPASR